MSLLVASFLITALIIVSIWPWDAGHTLLTTMGPMSKHKEKQLKQGFTSLMVNHPPLPNSNQQQAIPCKELSNHNHPTMQNLEEQNRNNDVHMSSDMLTSEACSLCGAGNHQLKRSGSEACTQEDRILHPIWIKDNIVLEQVCIQELDCKVHVPIAMQLSVNIGHMERPGPVFSSEQVRVNKKSVKVCTDGDTANLQAA